MDYKKANSILPEELLKAVQEYADGIYLYIPRKQSNKRKWGELKIPVIILQNETKKYTRLI